jgi:hypothetical protein
MVTIKDYIYNMQLVETCDKGYLVKYVRTKKDDPTNSDECMVELTSDEIRITHDYPEQTFEYIYEDKNGRRLYLIKIETEINDNASIEEAIDQLNDFDKYHVGRKLICSLKDLVDWRYENNITYGTHGCVVCHNKVKSQVQVFLEPYEYDHWLKENSYTIKRAIMEWAFTHLEVFKEKEKDEETTNPYEEFIKEISEEPIVEMREINEGLFNKEENK